MEAYVGNVSPCAMASDLAECLERHCGGGTVLSCSIDTAHGNWMSRGYAFVQFASLEAAQLAACLAAANDLRLLGQALQIKLHKSVTHGPVRGEERVTDIVLYMGLMRRLESGSSSAATSNLDYYYSATGVAAEFCFASRQLNLLLRHDGVDYKLELLFRNLRFVDACVESSQASHLLLQLSCPPLVFQGIPFPSDRVLDNPLAILRYYKGLKTNRSNYKYAKFGNEPTWCRCTDFTPGQAISQSLVYCLEFPADLSSDQASGISNRLLGFDASSLEGTLTLVAGQKYALPQEVSPILEVTESCGLPLDVVYKLNFLVQHSYINPSSVSRELIGLLGGFPEELCLAVLSELQSCSSGQRLTAGEVVSAMENRLRAQASRPRPVRDVVADEEHGYVKRLLVTPTKVYCTGPELERSNSVTRHYKDLAANFMRVSFVDEDFGQLFPDVVRLPTMLSLQVGLLPEPSSIYHRMLAVVRDGVTLGGRTFKFLAFSASQLREHSLWMFADAGAVTAESIRCWLGDFSGFTNVAKYAARLGQSFSSSRQSLEVFPTDLWLDDDVDNGTRYCFSDGIGRISKSFATSVAQSCNMPTVPSAFQIRYSGYKGVVAVDPVLTEAKLALRPSMDKFRSTRTSLNILKTSEYAPYYLNRQIIVLLSTLGVPDEVFERMQERQVKHLDKSLDDPETAVEVLSALASAAHSIMIQMLHAGYKPTHEPFLRKMLANFRALQLFLLRTKCRIYVPKGRCLLGCLDETRVLDYGQVFVQVSPTPGSSRRVLDDGLDDGRPFRGVTRSQTGCVILGQVVVTKNPCLHPGDVLVLQAVDVPELHHMVDCVVFPQRGKRPHPNECSGSDLDGDLYFVTWDKSLVPPSTHEAMDYQPGIAAQLDHPVTIEEVQKFFVDSMLQDSLGVISNAHLVHADREPEQARHPRCLELAQLSSTAVDFAKTGIPAVLPVDARPRDYPDFMENEFKATYPSTSVLGKLYRSLITNTRLAAAAAAAASREDIEREFDDSLAVDGYEQHLPEAKTLKELFEWKLRRLLQHYSISETELISGDVLGLGKANDKLKRDDSRDRIGCAMKLLTKEAGGWFQERGGGTALAYAWYYVTYHPEFRGGDAEELLSFPWVVPAVVDKLVSIKKTAR